MPYIDTRNFSSRAYTILLGCILFALSSQVLLAQPGIHSRKDGDWYNPGTWQGRQVPTANDYVWIQDDVTMSTDVACAGFRILQPGTLGSDGSTPVTLTVTGEFDIKNGFYHDNLVSVVLDGPGIDQDLDCSSFYNLSIDGSYVLQSSTTISGLLYVASGASLVDNAAYIIDLTKPDTAFINDGSVILSSTVRYSSTSDQYVAGATYANLELLNTGTTKTAIGDITVDQNLLVESGVVFAGGSNTITLNGTGTPFSLNGTFLYETSTVDYAALGNQTISGTDYYNLSANGSGIKYTSGSSYIYGDLVFSAQIEGGADTLHIQGSYLSDGAGFITGTGFAVRFFGPGVSRLKPSAMTQQDMTHLIIDKNTVHDTVRVVHALSGYNAAIKTTAAGNLDIFSGVLDLAGAYILRLTGTTQTGRFILSNGAVIRVAFGESLPFYSGYGAVGQVQYLTHTVGNNSFWELYGGNQTVRGVGQAIDSYGYLVLQGTGVKAQAGNVYIATALIRTTPTYYANAGYSTNYAPGTSLVYLLSDSSAAAFQVTQTTADDEYPALNGPTNVVISNNYNVSLHAPRTMSGMLQFFDGKFILQNNIYTIDGFGSIVGASNDRYIVTNSSGYLNKVNVGPTGFLYPIGPDVTSYNPAILQNSGTIDSYGARVQPWLSYASYDPTKIVTRQWTFNEQVSGGSNLQISLQWDTAHQASQFNPSGTVVMLRSLAGAWGEYYSTSVTGSGPYTATASGIIDITDFHISNDTYLPVELNSFSAEPFHDTVILEWSTATELNNTGFEIMRSDNGKRWKTIAFVEGAGTSSEPLHYSFTDRFDDIDIRGNEYFYKLRQIDADGSWSESELRTVSFVSTLSASLQVYPAPCIHSTTFSFYLTKPTKVNVKVYDAEGMERALLIEETELEEGRHYLRFSRGSLSPGMYFIRLSSEYESQYMKFYISH
jgi:hypothetical protein